LAVPGKLYLSSQFLLFYSYICDTKHVLHIGKIASIRPIKDVMPALSIHIKQDMNAAWTLKHMVSRDKALRAIEIVLTALEDLNLTEMDRNSPNPLKIPLALQKKLSMLIDPTDEPYNPPLRLIWLSAALLFAIFNMYLLWRSKMMLF
jgi:hypothetical protein